jgi:hypothetical protein
MNETTAKIGLGSDLFDTAGRPMFGSAPLQLFSDAGLSWDLVAVKDGRLPPQAFTDYEALLIGGAKVADAELGGESGRLRVIAAMASVTTPSTLKRSTDAASCSPIRRSLSGTRSPP